MRDLDSFKILKNQSWLPYLNCTYNSKLLLGSTNLIGVNSIATFDGDSITPIGDSTIYGVNSACVYKGELYLINSNIAKYAQSIIFYNYGFCEQETL